MEEKVKNIIVDALQKHKVKLKEVVSKASLVNDLGADSLDIVELVLALENKFR